MNIFRQSIIVLVVCLTGVVHASAQSYDEHGNRKPWMLGPVSINVGGSIYLPTGATGARLDTGRGVTAGVGLDLHRMFSVSAEYGFSYSSADSKFFDSGEFDGHLVTHFGTLNAIFHPVRGRFGFYMLGGVGLYYRRATLTQFAGAAPATFCDPTFLACYPTVVQVDEVLGTKSSTDFGVNGGIGVYAVIEPPVQVYMEARYNFIWGPTYTLGSKHIDADGQFVAITLGLRF